MNNEYPLGFNEISTYPKEHHQELPIISHFRSITKETVSDINYGGFPNREGFINRNQLTQKIMNNELKPMNNELTIIKDRQVKSWLNSDLILDNVINDVSSEIRNNAVKFDTEIEHIHIREAYKGHPFEEIEIEVKVPEKLDIYKLNKFWDYLGKNISFVLDNEKISRSKIKEIKEKLLIVVTN